MVSAAFISGSAAFASSDGSSSVSIKTMAPRDFQSLDTERQLVVDVYYGGRKLTEAPVTVRGGELRFDEAAQLTSLIPGLILPNAVQRQLASFLASNAKLVCGPFSTDGECGSLVPEVVGIIFDEDNFRVDLFVSSSSLAPAQRADAVYLAPPEKHLTLINRYGATVSGNNHGDQFLHLQNRTIISNGRFRLRSDSSLDNVTGAALDILAIEHDRPDWRYTAGLFWAPGGDLLGRRKIIGAGVTTQLDTRVDKRAILGTPLALYLQQTARVDILIDNRLVASRIYPAGNILVDTANLPDGSYPLVIRIHESGRPVREESQFFTKGSEIAPVGRPLLAAFAGVIADEQGRPSGNAFYEMSAAYRLAPNVGADAKVFGTASKAITELGGTVFTSLARLRAAALISTKGDYGALLRAASSGRGPVSFSFDLRKVISKGEGPLLPTTKRRGTFNDDVQSQIGDQGSYTQGTAIFSSRVRSALVRLTGLYRRTAETDADYSLGASVELPVVQTLRWNAVVQANLRKTSQEFAVFAGFRAYFNRRGLSLAANGGFLQSSKGQDRLTGEVQGALQREVASGANLTAEAAVGHDPGSPYARAGVRLDGNLANFRGEILQRFGQEAGTQYAASVDGGIAWGGGHIGVHGRDVSDSAIVVTADGASETQQFDVLVDDSARARVRAGRAALIFVQPYENYRVRLRPIGDGLANFDVTDKVVTLHPGRVINQAWSVAPTFILFGRAVGTDDLAISNADVVGDQGVGRTDDQGYFQIETRVGSALRVKRGVALDCRISPVEGRPEHNFLAAGDVKCL